MQKARYFKRTYPCKAQDKTYAAIGAELASCDAALFARMSSSFGQYSWVLYLIVGLSFALIVIIPYEIRVLQKKVLRPVRSIGKAMLAAKGGDLDVRVQPDAHIEEFSVMGETFNNMLQRIRELKVSMYEEKLQKQKAEIQFLQAQSQPHFYSNALNTISNLAQVGKIDTIQRLCRSLSDFFRTSMRQTSELIPLTQELRLVKDYTMIQEIRYGGDFAFRIDSDPKLDDVMVPPLIIQTFIENAIKHSRSDEGVTDVAVTVAREEEGEVRIDVTDNGSGFDEAVLRKLRTGEPIVSETGRHIGIQNLRSRLELIYGQRVTLDFASAETGAHICVRFPLCSEGEQP